MLEKRPSIEVTRIGVQVRFLKAGLASCVALFAASYVWFVLTPAGQRWDHDTFRYLSTNTSPVVLDGSWWLLGAIGQIVVLLGAALTVLLIGIIRRRLLDGVAAAAAIPLSVGASRLFKVYVLDRPEIERETLLARNSFPSGHATAATAVGFALLLVAPRGFRPGVCVLGTCWAVASGFAVVIAGWHRPSDAIGSVALAGAIFCAAALLSRARRLTVLDPPARHRLDRRPRLFPTSRPVVSPASRAGRHRESHVLAPRALRS